jgi:hypothetical protein
MNGRIKKIDKTNACVSYNCLTFNPNVSTWSNIMATKKAAVQQPAVKRTTNKPAAIAWAVPNVFVDNERHTFIQIGSQIGVPAYITSRLGYVTIEYHGKGMPELKPTKFDKPFKQAIESLLKGAGQLDVSSLAKQVIDAINGNDDPARDDFIDTVVKANKAANKPASNAKPATKASTKASKPDRTGFVTLKQLLDEFKLDGKLVRGKLRAHYTKPADGWIWLEKEADAIRADMRKWFKIQAAA